MCPSGATCILTDCCFSVLALCKFNPACRSRTKQTSPSSNLIDNLLVLALILLSKITELALTNDNSLTELPPFFNVLFAYLFSMKFLYFFII